MCQIESNALIALSLYVSSPNDVICVCRPDGKSM